MTDEIDDDPYGGGEPAGGRSARKKRSALARVPAGDEAPITELDRALAGRATNDIGNAERLQHRFGDALMHVPGLGWHGWDELRWSGEKGEDIAFASAQKTAKEIWREIRALRERLGAGKLKADERDAIGDRIDYLSQWAVTSGNIGRLKAMLEASEGALRVEMDDLDADPWLLYAPNEAITFAGGAGRDAEMIVERDRAHRVTKLTRADYAPLAVAPKWERFLHQTFPDDGLREFVQRAAGYSITGDMSEESFFMCWGKGRNGKGTFLRLIAWVLGDYAKTIPVDLLLDGAQKTGNEPSPQYASLTGVRFAMTTEPSPGARFNEGELKTLTGRDTIRIRGLFEKPFDLVPKFKLWIACNDRPTVRSASDAYWRRVKLIPFVANVSEDETNKNLELELREEASGILAWLLEGRGMWAEQGLSPPDAVRVAVEGYRDEMDPLHRFLEECTELAPRHDVKGKELRTSYAEWCEQNGEEPLRVKTFGSALTNKGYKRKHSNGTVYVNMSFTEMGRDMLQRGESREASKGKGW